MYFTKSSTVKAVGFSAIVSDVFQSPKITLVSEITFAPLGFALYYNPKETEAKGIDITSMADWDYDAKCNLELPFVCLETNNFLPLDYRTREEIIKQVN